MRRSALVRRPPRGIVLAPWSVLLLLDAPCFVTVDPRVKTVSCLGVRRSGRWYLVGENICRAPDPQRARRTAQWRGTLRDIVHMQPAPTATVFAALQYIVRARMADLGEV